MERDPDVLVAENELSKIKRKKARVYKHKGRIASSASKFYGIEQVMVLVPFAKSTIYKLVSEGEFPKPIKLGKRATVWIKSEVDAWIDMKINRDG